MKKYDQQQTFLHARFFSLWLIARLSQIGITMTVQIYYSCQTAGAKASDKDVKAHKEKTSDQNLEVSILALLLNGN